MSGEPGGPSHGDLLAEIRSVREDLAPLIEMKPELKEAVDIIRALKVGGKGAKLITAVATSLLALGGAWIALRAMWEGFWGGSA